MRAPRSARPAVAALAWAAAMLVLFAASSAAMFPFDMVAVLDGMSFTLMLLFMTVIGVLIARHQPAHPVGWLFSLAGALVTTSIGMGSWARWAAEDAHWPGAAWGFWLGLWPWAVGLLGFMLLLPPLFPDGRTPGHGWRWLLRADLTVIATMTVVLMLQPITVSDDAGEIRNPLGVSWADSVWVIAPVVAAVVALVLAGLASAIVRYRRSAGIERLQMREVLGAAVLTVIGFVGISVLGGREFLYNLDYLLIPTAVGLAMLRYRLYDVDVIIRRTLTYAALVATLAVIYLAGIALIGSALRNLAGQSDALGVTISTLAVAAAFQPLRGRIRAIVDRRFNRAAYDGRAAVDAFSGRLREQIDLDALSQELLETVSGTLQPTQASLWLRPVTTPERSGATP